jgi:hypothetical protein
MGKGFGLGAMGAGGILSAGNSFTQGQLASRLATMQAGQLEGLANQYDDSAKEEFGKGTIRAKSARSDKELLQSRIIALAAAGGGVNQKSVIDNLLDVEEKGEYNSLMELYNGSSSAYELRRKADQTRMQAITTRFEGKQARRQANFQAISSVLSTGGNMASFSSKFNQNTQPNVSNQNSNTGGNMFSPYASRNTNLTTSFR